MQGENARGALLMIVGMAVFTLNDTCMKLLLGEVPLFQALMLRGIVMTGVLALLAWRAGALARRHLAVIAPRDRWLIAARCVADTASTWFFLKALVQMPLANLTAIFQSLPLAVTLAAAVFLAEPVGWRRLVAIMLGFCGVLLIVRPDAGGFDLFSLYALISVACVTLRELVTRRVARAVPSLLIALANVGVVTLFGTIGAIGQGFVPVPMASLGLLALAGLFNVTGYLMTVMAIRLGDLSFITPFRYTALIWALVLGLVVFGQWPQPLTLLGASLIVATGMFTFYRERRVKQMAARITAPR